MEQERLINFIEINHHFMTLSEISEETGSNIPLIKRICDKNGWHPITIPERMRLFIESNKHLSLEDQAEKAGLSVGGLKHHYELNNIPLPEKKKKRDCLVIEEECKNKQVKLKNRKVVNRSEFTYYNQSGTDMLDELNGIRTTNRNDRLLL